MSFFDSIREIVKYRQLLYMIAWRDIRIKYKQSVMGFMWAIFMPMIIISAGILVKYAFSVISGNEMTGKHIASVTVKALPWSFFVASIRFTTSSLVANINLVTKIYFPRAICPISSICSQLFDFVIAATVLVIFLSLMQVGISLQLLWVPVLLLLLISLVIGLGLVLATANLFFRDIKYLVEVILTFGIFFTPVFYEISMFNTPWIKVLLLNPVAPILEALNASVVLHQTPNLPWLLYSAGFAVVGLFAAFAFFRKMEPIFAESI